MLVTVLTRPRDLSEWWAALAGATLELLLGLLPLAEAWRNLLHEWHVYLFFLGLMVSFPLADRAGVFTLSAAAAARWADRSP